MLDRLLSVHDAYPVTILCKRRIEQQYNNIAQKPKLATPYS